MANNREHEDLIDIAQWTLEKVVTRMKKKRLQGKKLERMKLLDVALTNIRLARF